MKVNGKIAKRSVWLAVMACTVLAINSMACKRKAEGVELVSKKPVPVAISKKCGPQSSADEQCVIATPDVATGGDKIPEHSALSSASKRSASAEWRDLRGVASVERPLPPGLRTYVPESVRAGSAVAFPKYLEPAEGSSRPPLNAVDNEDKPTSNPIKD
ncbi:MAG: hypothetical protein ABWY34_01690 [Pseudoxanthomonas sp.]